jgi:hypothetical protein
LTVQFLRDEKGLGLCFLNNWTLEEKAEALREHLGVGIAEARRIISSK